MRTYLRLAKQRAARRGLSLPELLAAMLILALIAASLGGVASAVRTSNAYCTGHTQAAQHARVTLARLESNIGSVVANENFPGCRVFSSTVSGSTFPDTVVIWKPLTTAVAPTGLPRVNELVLYTYNPSAANELIEIRDTTNTAAAPTAASTSAWTTLVSNLKSSNSATRTVLTTRLHTAQPAVGVAARGAVRFLMLAAPTDTQWASYRAGTTAWDAIDWPLDRYGSSSGSRMVALQIELQMDASDGTVAAGNVLPFFGSASYSYQLSR
jgi:prepilin-type N-terminal cleavage/methylation domain-containing protein